MKVLRNKLQAPQLQESPSVETDDSVAKLLQKTSDRTNAASILEEGFRVERFGVEAGRETKT